MVQYLIHKNMKYNFFIYEKTWKDVSKNVVHPENDE